jgi:hypothetical protein
MLRWAGPQIVTLRARVFRRTLSLALVVALLAPASALGQQNQQPNQDPFPPLPQPQPTAAPPPEDDDGFLGLDSEIGGSATLYVIAGALLVAFVGIGMFISRDARRSLPAAHRPDARRSREEGPHKHKRQAKARARARSKAQRSARRKNR